MSEPEPREPIIPSIQKGVAQRWQSIEDGTREWWRGYRRWLHMGRNPATATLSPDTVEAGSRQRLTLTVTVGEGGIEPYGHVAVEPPLQPLLPTSPAPPRPQPRLSVTCSNPAPELQVEVADGIIDVLIKEYPLLEGDELVFHFGEPLGNPAIMPASARRHPVPVAIAPENWPVYQLIEKIPELTVTGSEAQRFQVVARPAVTLGQPFDLHLMAADGVHGNPDPRYEGAVRLLCSDSEATLPEAVEMTTGDGGMTVVEGCRLGSDGVHYITAVDDERGISGRSNPVTREDWFGGRMVFFGDIHVHTWHCDGKGTPQEAYRWSREVRAMDFGAITNHVEGAKRYEVDDFWPIIQRLARQHNAPGRYVAFLAYEWGGWDLFGDKCVYFLDDDQPCFAANDPESNRPDRLWESLPEGRAITIPHHVKFGGRTDWSYFDPLMQPLAEVYSIWGIGEELGSHCIQQALARGYRFGFIASSDNHNGEPGEPNNGIAALLADELTRESLFSSMQNRATYATTGRRILLSLTIDAGRARAHMGEELTAPRDQPREIAVRGAGTSDIVALELLRNNEPIEAMRGYAREMRIDYRDEDPPEGPTWYYARLTQRDGAMAWSSPIWVDPE
ncbi:MAG: CehA/McbA family metallohydrolase [Armatimonadota bacterium]|nr:CehA/McbA family metallohydrolase [Armatimonadota bacterium]